MSESQRADIPRIETSKEHIKMNVMKKEINPRETSRAEAFELWMSSPMPMVTMTKTFDVTRILRISRKRGWKFNMILCWAIGRAALRTREFYLLPEKVFDSSWRLMQYDSIAINVIVENKKGGLNSCDIPYSDDIQNFNEDYLRLTTEATTECKSSSLEDAMVVGTSAMIGTELDSIVNQYTDLFCNPMLMWGSYRRGFFHTTLPISFQFHHVQMDGSHAARFLELLQAIIISI
jgi:chloramphenicol O-acetyltransferase type A